MPWFSFYLVPSFSCVRIINCNLLLCTGNDLGEDDHSFDRFRLHAGERDESTELESSLKMNNSPGVEEKKRNKKTCQHLFSETDSCKCFLLSGK